MNDESRRFRPGFPPQAERDRRRASLADLEISRIGDWTLTGLHVVFDLCLD